MFTIIQIKTLPLKISEKQNFLTAFLQLSNYKNWGRSIGRIPEEEYMELTLRINCFCINCVVSQKIWWELQCLLRSI